jgi:hypothetical protein
VVCYLMISICRIKKEVVCLWVCNQINLNSHVSKGCKTRQNFEELKEGVLLRCNHTMTVKISEIGLGV